jgi:hypothetical protein
VLGGDLDLAGRNPEQRFAIDDETVTRKRYALLPTGALDAQAAQ